MSVKTLYSQTPAPTLLLAIKPFEIFILYHTNDEVPRYDGR